MPIPGFRPPPGPQMPNRYPFVGENYKRLGEQKGWIYNPYQDRYVPDPNVQKELADQAGVGEKKPPGLGETLLPIAGVGLAIEGGRMIGKEGVGGLLSLGDKPAAVGGINTGAATAGQAGSSALGASSGADVLAVGQTMPQVGPTIGNAAALPPSPSLPGAEAAAPGLLAQAPGTTLMGSQTLGAALPAAGVAAGAYTGYQQATGLKDFAEGEKLDWKQKAALALPTFGASLLSDQIQSKLGMGPSTREIAKKNTKGLMGVAPEDATYQNYVAGMREQYDKAPTDPSKPFAGKYASWDEYKKGGLEAGDLTGVYGNIKVYGPEWAKLTQEQRQAITQENINSGIYDSSKGDVHITDEATALANRDKILGTQVKGAAPVGQAPPPPKEQQLRSSTRSPGFDKNGKRIPQALLGV